MKRKITIRTLLFLFGTAMLGNGGCHPNVTQTITPSSPDFNSGVAAGIKENVVMMPLADYSKGTTPDNALRRQSKIMAALSHQLSGIGMTPAVQEDVNVCLLEKHVLTPAQDEISQYDADKWGGYVRGVADSIMEGSAGQGNVNVGVTPEIIKELGKRFHAKYLLRGRIIEYQVGQERTFNPLRRGILPFAVDGTTTTLFGIAKSEQYDTWQEMATAGTAGALLGTNAETPFNGNPSAHGSNALVWGAAGAGIAHLSNQGGDVPEARVQVELALQSTSDGQVVWSNRTEFTVTPENAYDRYDQQYLLAQATEVAAATLVFDMRRRVYGIPAPAVAPTQPVAARGDNTVPAATTGNRDVYPPMPQATSAAPKK